MTTTTTISGNVSVQATKEEFIAFAVSKASGFTREMLFAELATFDVIMPKKTTKPALAGRLFDELEKMASAADETSVAENKSMEVEVDMEQNEAKVTAAEEVQKVMSEIQRERNAKGWERSAGSELEIKPVQHYINPAGVEMMNKVNAAKDAYFKRIGEYKIVVKDVEFYAEKREATREEIRERRYIREIPFTMAEEKRFIRIVGEVTVRLPEGYAEIKRWDPKAINSKGKLGAPVWVPFEDVNLNVAAGKYDSRRPLPEGDGLLVLNIVEFADADGMIEPNSLSVSLPTEKGKDGTKWPIFRTADIRYIKEKDATYKDEPRYNTDNNLHFNAMVSAYVQMVAEEFVQGNPLNHGGYDKSNCVNMTWFSNRDEVYEDIDTSAKSRAILQQPDIMQLSQVGSEQPRVFCSVTERWLDEESTHLLNELEKIDRAGGLQGLDEEGELRFARHDEVVVAGKLAKKADVRRDGIRKICSECPFYCGNAPKSNEQVNKERDENGGGFVSPFMKERPKTKYQAVQTLIQHDNGEKAWINGFPYELDGELKGIRVKYAGATVIGDRRVNNMLVLGLNEEGTAFEGPSLAEYVVPVEDFDERAADVTKFINHIFYAAFNFSKLTESQVEKVFDMVDNPPVMTDAENRRFEKAIFWLATCIEWAQEAEEAKHAEKYPRKFFATLESAPEGATEVHIEEVMFDVLFRTEAGTMAYGLGYHDLQPNEFARYLDEAAIDLVDRSIDTAESFYFVGGSEKDKGLLADAMQHMLQNEVTWTFVNGVRRDANPAEALENLVVCEELKSYIKKITKL